MQETVRPLLRTAALGVVLIVCAGLLDAEPLYVAGSAFLVLSFGAVVWVVVGTRGVRATRTVGVTRAMEEQAVPVEIVVTSPRPLPTGGVLDALLPALAPLATGRRVTRVRIDVRFERRGRKVLAPPRVAVRDPFGLLVRIARGPRIDPDEVLILPRIEPVVAPGGGQDGTGALTLGRRTSVAAEVELDGLRQAREGTSASRIYWPSIAKRGEPLERRLRDDSDTRPLVVLDPRAAAAEEDLDAAVRAAASLAVHLARAGGCALLIPGDRRPAALDPGLVGWAHLHARLALVDGDTPPPLTGLATRRGPIVYVAARRLTRPPRALAHAPGGGRVLVVPGPIAGRRPAFAVADCLGYELSKARRADLSPTRPAAA
ncbi:MAG TPA: DUF58 domain-containing protein [Baekduia sp.]|uniref:DUF58 domain-containing protein n=1 Tax=Baekduia sp. TaxID=2600305 RepID=UPI002D7953C5|nr:DUF58 domain-containing protein [Baekduia sp.]HET6505181.1 DUF58 domain-containing protein [Baekduia sp.]